MTKREIAAEIRRILQASPYLLDLAELMQLASQIEHEPDAAAGTAADRLVRVSCHRDELIESEARLRARIAHLEASLRDVAQVAAARLDVMHRQSARLDQILASLDAERAECYRLRTRLGQAKADHRDEFLARIAESFHVVIKDAE